MFVAHKRQGGFTLIEILIVIGIIAILAAVVIIAVNPGRQFNQANDTQRNSNANAILNAIGQYQADNRGQLPGPGTITTTDQEICKTDATDCTGLLDLSNLTDNGIYINEIPTDPDCPQASGVCSDADSTGYLVKKESNNR